MLATGGSAVHACEIIKRCGVARIKFLAILAAPEGIARLTAAMPDVAIHVGAVDDRLNDVGYIVFFFFDSGYSEFYTTHA